MSRRCSISEPTAKRRARMLAQRGLVIIDPRRFFEISAAGLEALGPSAAPPPRWVDPMRISAAAGRDVAARSRGEQADGDAQGVRQIGRPSKWDGGSLVEERLRA